MCTVGRGEVSGAVWHCRLGVWTRVSRGPSSVLPVGLGWGVQRCPLKEAQGTCSWFHGEEVKVTGM